MDDFLKNFKDNLDNRPEPAFEERLWERLDNDMKAQEEKPKRGFFWWLAIPGLLLLASNLFLITKLQNTTAEKVVVEIQRDTIYKTNVVFQTDTIFQTKIKKERIIEYVEKPDFALTNFKNINSQLVGLDASNKNYSSSMSLVDQWNFYRKNNIKPNTLTPFSQKPMSLNKSKTLSKNIIQPLNYLPGLKLAMLDYSFADLDLKVNPLKKKKAKKTLGYHLQQLQPNGLRAGLNTGFVRPIYPDIKSETGYQIGLATYADFSPSLRMWLDASFTKIKFESDQMNERIGIPVIQPPNDDFVFENADVAQPSLQYSVGIQYLFNANKKWRPFVGAGYAAISVFPYEVSYDFENEANGFEWIFEERVNQQGLLTNFALFQLGLEYEINSKLAWQFKTGYRINLESKGFQSPPLLNIQTGIHVKIK